MNHGLDHPDAEASSSSHSPHEPAHAQHRGNNDASRPNADDHDLLDEDPLQGNLGVSITFKRKPKKRGLLDQGTRLLASLTGSSPSDSDGASLTGLAPGLGTQEHGHTYLENLQISPRSPRRRGGANGSPAKDGAPPDWHVEGPGRRVGYEDLTAIDWIFEYTKERNRLRVLRSNAQGLLGKLQLSFDSAQEWIILVATGILVGTLAAVIDITTDWLGDLKAGHCTNEDGGAFYLNRAFCCLGYEEESQCSGWRPWASALHVTSTAGSYIIEWFFFATLSVRFPPSTSLVSHLRSINVQQVFFAFCASILVQEFAIHAKHSGIPEIKTVLGGFIIKKFLGVWTLVTKSLGLV